MKALREEVRAIGDIAEKGAEATGLARRIEGLERARRALELSAEQSKAEIETLRSTDEQLEGQVSHCTVELAVLGRKAEASLAERTSTLSERHVGMAKRLEATEAELERLAVTVESAEAKASYQEVSDLRRTLGNLTEGIKDREQAVLFGAKCLSCNRVFDDVQQEPNVVNLHAEKQRAQVFAEIHRAMHSPRSDPLEPIQMIAVKVGRTQDVKAKTGPGHYQGRDAGCHARGLEDVQLLPVRGGGGGGAATASMPSTPQAVRRPDCGPRGRTAPTPRSLLEETTRQPRKMDDQDFKYPLSQLLGRSPA